MLDQIAHQGIVGQNHPLAVDRLFDGERTEIDLVVLGHLPGGEKLRIEIPRGKLEQLAFMLLEDSFIIPLGRLGPHHDVDPVIVGGYGQRPGAEFLVVMPQHPGRGMRSLERIAPLVDGIIHVQLELFAGGFGELPDAGRSEFPVCLVVEG